MGKEEDKEKAEKLAAAKKRVAQLQKKKKAGAKSGATSKDKSTKDDTPKSPTKDAADAEPEEDGPTETEEKPLEDNKTTSEEPVDADEADFNAAIAAATSPPPDEGSAAKSPEDDTFPADAPSRARHIGRQASISLQSKLRSTSFRDTAPGPTSPGAGPLARVEELERENKRLAEEAASHESRWRRTEEQLEELREESVAGESKTIESLKSEIELLKRQQRTGSTSGGGGKTSRRESSANALHDSAAQSHLKDLEAKDATIADMQLEISRMRGQLSSQTEGCETHGEQISSLQSTLSSTETKLRTIETELADTKKALHRASEKAVSDGTERTSKDTRIRSLEREIAEATSSLAEAARKADQLEKKVEVMNKLHREAEGRAGSKLSAAEAAAREIPALRAKVATLEAENAKLREKHKRAMSGGGADEGIDDLEDEERRKLERRIRELEGQVFELQRGVWRDKRTALQPGMGGGSGTDANAAAGRPSLEGRATQEEGFDEVDLSGAAATSRRASSFFGASSRGATASPGTQQQQQKHSNFTQYLSSGFNAFLGPQSPGAGAATTGGGAGRPRNDSLLQDFDGDEGGDGFDEAAFARAQREEEMKKMVEHVREVKRGLGRWKGWRLDLVETRKGDGVGAGEVFEV
ncbi:uncharacterized protein HMPREF1541_02699 [Cyphellophora europaea CBS 101466]|uniref:M protein repeat protein n=1 Tax=Cyphellophora europaea (strain CBS 101466) TaxID=1220924 RepID=W2S4L6_CYPE1|nr:uncharacterized protein HMPREF1541_02699 [Cyphellophora europaea CBS 101466]ETN43540.1 hypothetical protein HMPREF1541_02699 [Cyphellophora europaea CBS 101466]